MAQNAIRKITKSVTTSSVWNPQVKNHLFQRGRVWARDCEVRTLSKHNVDHLLQRINQYVHLSRAGVCKVDCFTPSSYHF